MGTGSPGTMRTNPPSSRGQDNPPGPTGPPDPPRNDPSQHDPSQNGPPPRKPHVDPATFFALDLRVGRIVDAKPFEKAHKPAYRVKVDFGPTVGVLETSAQITRYPLEGLVGRSVVAVINIGRKKIAGLTSEFLILGALDPDGTVRLLGAEPESPPGAPVA